MNDIAPTCLAQSWDNVGLIVGDLTALVSRVLLTIDLTEAVLDEAISRRAEFILAYHPPIFKPIRSLQRPGAGMEAAVFRCIQSGIAVYSPHTALDAAKGGTNDVLAELCGVTDPEPLEYVDEPGTRHVKLVVFVPLDHVEKVSDAVFSTGGGQIGDYSHCSFRVLGTGTFLGGELTQPTVGRKGRFETVQEIRLEVIVPVADLVNVLRAMRTAHPYEEPAYDVYPLQPKPVLGIGRRGPLARPTALGSLAHRLKNALGVRKVQRIGPAGRVVDRAILVAGSAGSLPFRVPLGGSDVIVTGEIRHHDALTIGRIGCTAIAVGHWASERPVLSHLAGRLRESLPGVELLVSRSDRDPFESL
jgi:dinuclear metal center YbgI/SA1388 family protein